MKRKLLSILMLVIISIRFNVSKKPYSKRQQSIWRLECELGVITDPECPVDGGWAPWGPWSACHGPCDDVGHRKRKRQCNNPPPSQDGTPCSGLTEQIEPCYLTNCTVNDFQKLVIGDTVRVKAFRQLEAVPALMERCLQTECPFEAIEAALVTDNTWQLSSELLWNALQCVKHNIGCPVYGEWGPWGAWSVCGARCGPGLQWRLRHCDNPSPSDALLTCTGTPLQSKICDGDQCLSEPQTSMEKRHWSDWGQWSSCSEKCGTGVRRRKRICNDVYKQHSSEIWGTSCRGQHDELEECVNKVCVLEGGWSGWSSWGPCSQTCGAGRRSRTRSCTRPIPAGGGRECVGPRTEVGSCHFTPCEVYSHTIAVLNGESHLQYQFLSKRSTFFHFFIRFMPLSPHGILVRRGTPQSPHIRLSLQKWHMCLDVSGSFRSCDLPRLCTTEVLEPAIWHSALITITSEAASLRLDDYISIQGTFPCDPELSNEALNIHVGERLHGEIQELIVNFMPLHMMIDRERRIKRTEFHPSCVSNIAYEKSNMEEAYLNLNIEQYLRIPCFDSQDEWDLSLTVKSKRDSGTLLFLPASDHDRWLYLVLQSNRLKLKLANEESRSESISFSEFPLDQWLDIHVSKKRGSNTIEASINSRERLHVLFDEDAIRKRRAYNEVKERHKITKSLKNDISEEERCDSNEYSICTDEFFVGGIPSNIGKSIFEDLTPFYGSIASLSIDSILQDLHSSNLEQNKDDKIQVSSRTASVSGSYYETAWSNSNNLNLTCLHTRSARSPHSAHWLYLDTTVTSEVKNKKVRSIDDGRVLRLVASANNDLRGFYTCRAHSKKYTRNVVTYGVMGKIHYHLTGPDVTTLVAVFTTVSLVLGTLLWLVIEGVHDLRNGYGFFRDAHLSPEEEAEAVCKFIDDNLHLIDSKIDARKAKAKARSKAHQISKKRSTEENDSQDLLREQDSITETLGESTTSEPEGLPALPETNSSNTAPSHNIYRCDPCYVSSPQHGSISSPKSKLTTSSLDTTPRFLCSRLLLRRIPSSNEYTQLRKSRYRTANTCGERKMRSSLLTIKSSTYVNKSPAQKILQKFQQLKRDDNLSIEK